MPQISYVKGNIFKIATKDAVIMHQVNCQNVMGAGIAKEFAQRYPRIKKQYHKLCAQLKPDERLGHLQLVALDENRHLYGLNSFTQLFYGNSRITGQTYTDEALLINNILSAATFTQHTSKTLYIPKGIGCGLAGGDWSRIEKAIHRFDVSAKIVIVEFN